MRSSAPIRSKFRRAGFASSPRTMRKRIRFRLKSASKFATEFRSMAERQIRRDLVIETIAEREALAATEKDLDDRITEQAEKRGVNPGQLYAQLEKSGRLKEIERSLTEDKVFQWLLEKNEVQTES